MESWVCFEVAEAREWGGECRGRELSDAGQTGQLMGIDASVDFGDEEEVAEFDP